MGGRRGRKPTCAWLGRGRGQPPICLIECERTQVCFISDVAGLPFMVRSLSTRPGRRIQDPPPPSGATPTSCQREGRQNLKTQGLFLVPHTCSLVTTLYRGDMD